jgi:molybdopterin-biosynthesis enzyme MoeA-like protein
MKTQNPQFFALIIGTEILNRRRQDAHFAFLSNALLAKGYHLKGSFVIEDDPALIVDTIKLIASNPHAILFSFGGIGSTPDDHTRACAAQALRDGKLYTHHEAKEIIEAKLKERAYPHAIGMAELPKGAKLLYNRFNNMPAFFLDERYFFMPGFPQMSHPMIEDILLTIPPAPKTYRYTLTAECKESFLIDIMEQMPKEVALSSLPKITNNTSFVILCVSSQNQALAQQSFAQYIDKLEQHRIPYQRKDSYQI